jgi:hypothetical protein
VLCSQRPRAGVEASGMRTRDSAELRKAGKTSLRLAEAGRENNKLASRPKTSHGALRDLGDNGIGESSSILDLRISGTGVMDRKSLRQSKEAPQRATLSQADSAAASSEIRRCDESREPGKESSREYRNVSNMNRPFDGPTTRHTQGMVDGDDSEDVVVRMCEKIMLWGHKEQIPT